MEELTEEQRLKVSKMSDDRLRRKLVQAGYREIDVTGLDRNTMLAYVARVVLAETAYVQAQAESVRIKMVTVTVMARKDLLLVVKCRLR